MARIDTDILISGAGIAGLVAAYAFGHAGFRVVCVDPVPAVVGETADGADLRTTAFLQPARDFLMSLGLWDRLAPAAAPLQVMRIVDAGGQSANARGVSDFDAADISQAPFGWNLPNWLLGQEFRAAVKTLPNVELRLGCKVASLLIRSNEALVRLSDGDQIRARLVIGADGRASTVRSQAGIAVKTWRYGQKALVCSAFHDKPHENVSTEIHRTGGPFTLVPLPDFGGQHRSAIVWMDRAEKSDARVEMDESAFNRAMFDRSAGLYGPLRLAGRRLAWPILSQHAEQLISERVALIAEAAHVVPPIGAQGLNMSLNDIATLLELAKTSADDPGAKPILAQYQSARLNDIRVRVRGIDLLNRASMAENVTLRDLRHAGLKVLHQVAPIRKSLMRKGLGLR